MLAMTGADSWRRTLYLPDTWLHGLPVPDARAAPTRLRGRGSGPAARSRCSNGVRLRSESRYRPDARIFKPFRDVRLENARRR